MKLISKKLDRNSTGFIAMIPEEKEDMWHVYNLICIGDTVQTSTLRKVQNETATGASNSYKVRTNLTICVEDIDFDTQGCTLRLKGKNVVENPYVKLGAYHTLEIEINRKFELSKSEWDSVALDRIDIACDPTKTADAAAIIMHEGFANICLINSNMTIVRSKIEVHIPKKRKGFVKSHEQGLVKFYETVLQGLLRHIDFEIVKVVLVASPGFLRDQFLKYMFQEAVKNDIKKIIENKSKFLPVHSSSGFKHSLNEILALPEVCAKMMDTKALAEVKALDAFYQTLMNDSDRAYYGYTHVLKACEHQAIETLLISDNLFRCDDVRERKKYVQLVDEVKDAGGDVKIFSSMHVSGERLANLTGCAAILRFPMPEIGNDETEDTNVNEYHE